MEMTMTTKTKREPGAIEHRTVSLVSKAKGDGLEFILSDATPDRYDDIILTSGWELENFNRNPIALFAHMGSFPIGKWSDVRVEDNALRGTLNLAAEGTSDRIDEIRKLVDADILRAVSVGFTPLAYEERKGDTYGLVYTKQELVECSLVSVPANPSALIQARSLGISEDTQSLVFERIKKTAVVKKLKGNAPFAAPISRVQASEIYARRIAEKTSWLSQHGKLNDAKTEQVRKERDELEAKQKALWES